MDARSRRAVKPSADLGRDVCGILEEARRIVAADGGWTQGAEARDAAGRHVHPLSRDAVAWSDAGAIYRASSFDGSAEAFARLKQAASAYGKPGGWNDDRKRSQDEVVRAFEEAVARAQGKSEDHCERCGRYGAIAIGRIALCPDCYEKQGSCCPEFDGDDLWEKG